MTETRLPGCLSDKAAVSQKPPVWIQLCLRRFVPSCAGDHATAPGCHPAAPAGPPWSWMDVAAARSVLGAWASPATSCTSVTRARGSSVTTAQHLQGQEAPATVSTGVPVFPGDAQALQPSTQPSPSHDLTWLQASLSTTREVVRARKAAFLRMIHAAWLWGCDTSPASSCAAF